MKTNLIYLTDNIDREINYEKFKFFEIKNLMKLINWKPNILYFFNLNNLSDYDFSLLSKKYNNEIKSNLCDLLSLKQHLTGLWFLDQITNNKIKYSSLSHCGKYIVFISSTRPIGVDIEKIKKINYNSILNRFKIDLKKNDIRNYKDFIKWWTMNESFIKFKSSVKENKKLNFKTQKFKLKYFISICY